MDFFFERMGQETVDQILEVVCIAVGENMKLIINMHYFALHLTSRGAVLVLYWVLLTYRGIRRIIRFH